MRIYSSSSSVTTLAFFILPALISRRKTEQWLLHYFPEVAVETKSIYSQQCFCVFLLKKKICVIWSVHAKYALECIRHWWVRKMLNTHHEWLNLKREISRGSFLTESDLWFSEILDHKIIMWQSYYFFQ